MAKQRLSRTAAAAKKARDLAYAKSPARRRKKAENQRRRRRAEAAGKMVAGLDWDHKDRRWKTPKENRGNDGEGTKKEGQADY